MGEIVTVGRTTGHRWSSAYARLGGLRENPGVWGDGADVVRTEECVRCLARRTTRTGPGHPRERTIEDRDGEPMALLARCQGA